MSEDRTTTAPARKTGSYEPATAEFEVWIEHPDAFKTEQLSELSKLELMKLGTPRVWYAHADIFVGREAPRVVFDPVAAWLRAGLND